MTAFVREETYECVYWSFTPDAPTLTVIDVFATTAVTARTAFSAGSPTRGYECWLSFPSLVHVNVTPPVAILTLLEVVREWVPIVRTKSPVAAL